MPSAPRSTDLAAVLDAVGKLAARVEIALDEVRAVRKGVDRMALPEGCVSHPDFDEDAPLWLLEKHRDGRPLRLYFPINCSTAAGAFIPTRHLADALRFTTRDAAERLLASDRRFAPYRIVPDRSMVVPDDEGEQVADLFGERDG